MKYISILVIVFLLSSVVRSQQTINGSIIHDGLEREYILYIPEIYDSGTSVPLVYNFHGYGSNAFEQMNYGDFRPVSDTVGFLIVHPLGTEDVFGNNHWNIGWGGSTVDDVGFTAALFDSISLAYFIDPEKVYSTGMSNGGFMSYHLACNLSDRIAAVASVTGSMNKGAPVNCIPDHPVPVMEIHGTADFIVPYNGSEFIESIPDVLKHWVSFNNCDTIPQISNLPDIDTTDGSTVEHQLFQNGDNGVEVQHFKVINGAHTWPGTAFGSPGTNYDINASAEIWNFFRRFDINGLINTTQIIQPGEISSDVKIYPVPAKHKITLEVKKNSVINYSVYSITGDLLFSEKSVKSPVNIDIMGLQEGLYFIKTGNRSYKFIKSR